MQCAGVQAVQQRKRGEVQVQCAEAGAVQQRGRQVCRRAGEVYVQKKQRGRGERQKMQRELKILSSINQLGTPDLLQRIGD